MACTDADDGRVKVRASCHTLLVDNDVGLTTGKSGKDIARDIEVRLDRAQFGIIQPGRQLRASPTVASLMNICPAH